MLHNRCYTILRRSPLMEHIKVAIVYRNRGKQNEDFTTKIWRFDPSTKHLYTLDVVKQQLLQYFPNIQQKGYGLSLYYKDSFVGEVKVESDGDLQESLASFTEEQMIELRTFYVEDRIRSIGLPAAAPLKKSRSYHEHSDAEHDEDDELSLENILRNACKEEGALEAAQPLYIDHEEKLIKCYWCKNSFKGSRRLKHVNQHVRKSVKHIKERNKLHRKGGAQRDLREFMQIDISDCLNK